LLGIWFWHRGEGKTFAFLESGVGELEKVEEVKRGRGKKGANG